MLHLPAIERKKKNDNEGKGVLLMWLPKGIYEPLSSKDISKTAVTERQTLLIRPLLAWLCVRDSIATLRKNVAFVEECVNGHNGLQT